MVLPSLSTTTHTAAFDHGLALLASGLARRHVTVQPLLTPAAPALPLGLPAPVTIPRAVLTTAFSKTADGVEKITQAIANLLVPPERDYSQCRENQLYAAMTAHAVAHLLYSPAAQSSAALKPMGIAVVSAIEDARVERLLCKTYPGVRQWFEAAIVAEPSPSDLTFNAFMARLDRILLLPGICDGNFWVNKAYDLFEATVTEHGLENYAAFRSIASILANDLGQMRVRMDPQHYAVPSPYRDDNSYLWQHPESEPNTEEQLSLQQAGAPLPPQEASANSERSEETSASMDMELARYTYPEWDRRQQRLKPDWCTVIEKLPTWQGLNIPNDEQAFVSQLAPIPLPRAQQLDRRLRLRRQWEGDDLDFNAVIEVLLDLRLNLQPDPRLFTRAGRGPRPTSLLVLMDVSESVNTIGNHGMSLLDIEKQAVLLLAQSNATEVGKLAIHAFSSNTRSEVNYYRLLDFGQTYSTTTANSVRALQGHYSTRLGAALRHASSLLMSESEGQRAILVISDGEPSDIDVHDSQYLIEDARQGVLRASRADIRISCLAVDSQVDSYLRRIFGWGNYGIATDARQLLPRLTQMSARLAAGR